MMRTLTPTEKGALSPSCVKRMAVAGLGAVAVSEEGLRKLASQLKLPKEMLGFVIQQAEKTKDDVSRVISEELRRFLQSDRLRNSYENGRRDDQ